MNKLRNMRAYLGGAMEFADGMGVDWRREWKQNDWGVCWLDPTDKPIDIGLEDIENHARRKKLKKDGQFDTVAKEMRKVRCVDLRMVDISDFLIFNIDIDIHTCGTYEEITTANRQKKPIICRIKQGTEHTPDWLLGMLPWEMIFSSWNDVKVYLDNVDSGSDTRSFNRWMFFDFHGAESLASRLKECKTLQDIEEVIFGDYSELAYNASDILIDEFKYKLERIKKL